jgi:hypothetical protein
MKLCGCHTVWGYGVGTCGTDLSTNFFTEAECVDERDSVLKK